MIKTMLTLVTLAFLSACGGKSHGHPAGGGSAATCTAVAPNLVGPGCSCTGGSFGSYDGGYDPGMGGYDYTGDPGYYDDVSDPGSYGSADSVSVDEESSVIASSPRSIVQAVNYDGASYSLYVYSLATEGRWSKVYLPPLPAAPAGGSSQSSQLFRAVPGLSQSLVLENASGERIDSQNLMTSNQPTPTKYSFSIVGGALIAAQS